MDRVCFRVMMMRNSQTSKQQARQTKRTCVDGVSVRVHHEGLCEIFHASPQASLVCTSLSTTLGSEDIATRTIRIDRRMGISTSLRTNEKSCHASNDRQMKVLD
eukprot:scaffold1120_cov142-Amphora_coffeaeformis.AAC.3